MMKQPKRFLVELQPDERFSLLGRRDLFGYFLNERGLLGTAVEIGTHQGAFANELLTHWKGTCLICVDPWKAGYSRGDPASQGDREKDYREAVHTLARYGDRVIFRRFPSLLAAQSIPDGSIDFVYVDGCHQQVRQDLEAWWPKLKPGGVLAGHDIYSLGNPGKGWDQFVRPEANRLSKKAGVLLWLVADATSNWSYFMVKPNG